ncbi:hypothetical protein [Chryseobacterium luteum]|uniref:Uncharacterized protein n=1 Tax=Chryseobacterium luteum TaxID=421531 RepID=A0A085ZEB9_9FLAO|nr:hypothetical protein [Chryseobacterium luteum]KFF02783.1 hypothetical protein IX38_12490 [Chryseobacterium luteum]
MNKVQKIFLAIGILFIAYCFFSSIMAQVGRNVSRMQASKSFTEDDFVENTYQVTEVWQRTFERQHMPGSKSSYIYLKVKGEPFNLNFGYNATDYGDSTTKNDLFLKYLQKGKIIKVKINKGDLAFAADKSFKKSVTDFFAGTNKEVEIYKLSVDGRPLFEQSILTPTFANRDFADIAIEHNLLRLGLILALLYALIYWIPKLVKKLKT